MNNKNELFDHIKGMRKVVINSEYGGFSLSDKAFDLYVERSTNVARFIFHPDLSRDDPVLVKIVEELGKESWGQHAHLKIVKIPDDIEWEIHDYDGKEWIAEKHRIWR